MIRCGFITITEHPVPVVVAYQSPSNQKIPIRYVRRLDLQAVHVTYLRACFVRLD